MRRFLVIDDAEVVCKVACAIAESLDHISQHTQSLASAFDIIQKQVPDVILVDWQIPGEDTHAFLNAVRELCQKKSPYVIYCATENDPDDIAKAMALGANDYLLKPFDRAGLADKFEQAALVTP